MAYPQFDWCPEWHVCIAMGQGLREDVFFRPQRLCWHQLFAGYKNAEYKDSWLYWRRQCFNPVVSSWLRWWRVEVHDLQSKIHSMLPVLPVLIISCPISYARGRQVHKGIEHLLDGSMENRNIPTLNWCMCGSLFYSASSGNKFKLYSQDCC